MYGPGQEHRDGPLTPHTREVWNYVIGGAIFGGILFLLLAAAFHWG